MPQYFQFSCLTPIGTKTIFSDPKDPGIIGILRLKFIHVSLKFFRIVSFFLFFSKKVELIFNCFCKLQVLRFVVFRSAFNIPLDLDVSFHPKSECSFAVSVCDYHGGLVGGKGGFGAGLKGRKRGGKKTTNFDAMRDVEGDRN
jgi:hypothetical protein